VHEPCCGNAAKRPHMLFCNLCGRSWFCTLWLDRMHGVAMGWSTGLGEMFVIMALDITDFAMIIRRLLRIWS
jgi:hypothetical protein